MASFNFSIPLPADCPCCSCHAFFGDILNLFASGIVACGCGPIGGSPAIGSYFVNSFTGLNGLTAVVWDEADQTWHAHAGTYVLTTYRDENDCTGFNNVRTIYISAFVFCDNPASGIEIQYAGSPDGYPESQHDDRGFEVYLAFVSALDMAVANTRTCANSDRGSPCDGSVTVSKP